MGGVRPLAGVRVLDLSRLLPGPFATFCLQGLGAEVVKVEEPGAGDYLRHTPPFVEHDGFPVGAWFSAVNRGKRSVALDLRRPDDRAALLAMLPGFDVLVESFRPGVLTRLGLDPQELRRRFPRLILASVTGWGQTGPWAALPGHDLGFVALSGMLDRPSPTMPHVQWGDLAGGGMSAALQIAAALYGRTQTGEGAWLDVAMLDGLVGVQPLQFAAGGVTGLLTGDLPNYALYPCADGWVAVGALEPQFAARLVPACGELTFEAVGAFCRTRTRAALAELWGDACVVPVLRLDEVGGHAQVAARGLFTPEGLPHPPTGPVEGVAPRLGEHTEAELARAGYQRA